MRTSRRMRQRLFLLAALALPFLCSSCADDRFRILVEQIKVWLSNAGHLAASAMYYVLFKAAGSLYFSLALLGCAFLFSGLLMRAGCKFIDKASGGRASIGPIWLFASLVWIMLYVIFLAADAGLCAFAGGSFNACFAGARSGGIEHALLGKSFLAPLSPLPHVLAVPLYGIAFVPLYMAIVALVWRIVSGSPASFLSMLLVEAKILLFPVWIVLYPLLAVFKWILGLKKPAMPPQEAAATNAEKGIKSGEAAQTGGGDRPKAGQAAKPPGPGQIIKEFIDIYRPKERVPEWFVRLALRLGHATEIDREGKLARFIPIERFRRWALPVGFGLLIVWSILLVGPYYLAKARIEAERNIQPVYNTLLQDEPVERFFDAPGFLAGAYLLPDEARPAELGRLFETAAGLSSFSKVSSLAGHLGPLLDMKGLSQGLPAVRPDEIMSKLGELTSTFSEGPAETADALKQAAAEQMRKVGGDYSQAVGTTVSAALDKMYESALSLGSPPGKAAAQALMTYNHLLVASLREKGTCGLAGMLSPADPFFSEALEWSRSGKFSSEASILALTVNRAYCEGLPMTSAPGMGGKALVFMGCTSRHFSTRECLDERSAAVKMLDEASAPDVRWERLQPLDRAVLAHGFHASGAFYEHPPAFNSSLSNYKNAVEKLRKYFVFAAGRAKQRNESVLEDEGEAAPGLVEARESAFARTLYDSTLEKYTRMLYEYRHQADAVEAFAGELAAFRAADRASSAGDIAPPGEIAGLAHNAAVSAAVTGRFSKARPGFEEVIRLPADEETAPFISSSKAALEVLGSKADRFGLWRGMSFGFLPPGMTVSLFILVLGYLLSLKQKEPQSPVKEEKKPPREKGLLYKPVLLRQIVSFLRSRGIEVSEPISYEEGEQAVLRSMDGIDVSENAPTDEGEPKERGKGKDDTEPGQEPAADFGAALFAREHKPLTRTEGARIAETASGLCDEFRRTLMQGKDFFFHQALAVEEARQAFDSWARGETGPQAVLLNTAAHSGMSTISLYLAILAILGRTQNSLFITPTRRKSEELYDSLLHEITQASWRLNVQPVLAHRGLADVQRERGSPQLLISDMESVHHRLLPQVEREKLAYFFDALELVVVENVEQYQGVRGAHACYIMRRLYAALDSGGRRAAPLLFATMDSQHLDSPAFARALLGPFAAQLHVVSPENDGAPSPPIEVRMVSPPKDPEGMRKANPYDMPFLHLVDALVQAGSWKVTAGPGEDGKDGGKNGKNVEKNAAAGETPRCGDGPWYPVAICGYRGLLPDEVPAKPSVFRDMNLDAAPIKVHPVDARITVHHVGAANFARVARARFHHGARTTPHPFEGCPAGSLPLHMILWLLDDSPYALLLGDEFRKHGNAAFQGIKQLSPIGSDNLYVVVSHLMCALAERVTPGQPERLLKRIFPAETLDRALDLLKEAGRLSAYTGRVLDKTRRGFREELFYQAAGEERPHLKISFEAVGHEGFLSITDRSSGAVVATIDRQRETDLGYPGRVFFVEGRMYRILGHALQTARDEGIIFAEAEEKYTVSVPVRRTTLLPDAMLQVEQVPARAERVAYREGAPFLLLHCAARFIEQVGGARHFSPDSIVPANTQQFTPPLYSSCVTSATLILFPKEEQVSSAVLHTLAHVFRQILPAFLLFEGNDVDVVYFSDQLLPSPPGPEDAEQWNRWKPERGFAALPPEAPIEGDRAAAARRFSYVAFVDRVPGGIGAAKTIYDEAVRGEMLPRIFEEALKLLRFKKLDHPAHWSLEVRRGPQARDGQTGAASPYKPLERSESKLCHHPQGANADLDEEGAAALLERLIGKDSRTPRQ